jgi:hypothetical protein
MNNNLFRKRLLISIGLGLFFGLLDFYGFATHYLESGFYMQFTAWNWGNPMMWTIIFNRFIIGMLVAVCGFVTIHPFFGFKIPALLRGAGTGAIVSLLMAITILTDAQNNLISANDAVQSFWVVIICGAIIGAIIDFVATKFAGEGKNLLS